MFAMVSKLLPVIATPERFRAGLEFTVKYYHANGVTLGSEPGGLYSKALQNAQNAVLSVRRLRSVTTSIQTVNPSTRAFRTPRLPKRRKTLSWGQGMTSMMPKQIKLFADGAIYSQLMQVREPYLDGHHGEWIMEPEVFAKAFRIYWAADYQIHVHVTGDAGVDMVLTISRRTCAAIRVMTTDPSRPLLRFVRQMGPNRAHQAAWGHRQR